MDKRGLLIFDLDGTLFRTETVTIPAVQKTFQDHDLPVPPEGDIQSFFGKPTREFYIWIRSLAPGEIAADVVTTVSRREIEMISETGELFPGVHDVLATLRGSVSKMVISQRAYGFRTPGTYALALYHGLGNLPMPESTHKFL